MLFSGCEQGKDKQFIIALHCMMSESIHMAMR